MGQNVFQAYKQAPWRIQIRNITWILLGIVGFLVVAVSNLNISAQTFAAGVEIQELEAEREQLIRRIADLNNELGYITSSQVLGTRGAELGFVPITDAEHVIFLGISGYEEPELEIEIPATREIAPQSLIKSIYTQSLWELFFQGALKINANLRRAEK